MQLQIWLRKGKMMRLWHQQDKLCGSGTGSATLHSSMHKKKDLLALKVIDENYREWKQS
jgi:hypothetical protein